MTCVNLTVLTAVTAMMLAGCASGPLHQPSTKSGAYGPSNAGLVVGRIRDGELFGTFIEFKAVTTGVRYPYRFAKDYSMWLPEGEYLVNGIGNRAGVLGPFERPLGFQVKTGQIAYVGTIYYGCSQRSRNIAWYGIKRCGFLALSECTVPVAHVPMCVIDEQDQTIKAFQDQQPEVAALPVESYLMR